jgi:hypothetical protein
MTSSWVGGCGCRKGSPSRSGSGGTRRSPLGTGGKASGT